MPSITLPAGYSTQRAEPQLVDYGFSQSPATGAAELFIDRPGTRWQCDFAFPPMKSDKAQVLQARLLSATRAPGIRIKFPLQGVNQSAVGQPEVDGVGQSGRSLTIRNANVLAIKEGFWFSLIDADGYYHLYKVMDGIANLGGGRATMPIFPMLRRPFADGSQLLFAEPYFEGRVVSSPAWSIPVGHLSQISFTVRETG